MWGLEWEVDVVVSLLGLAEGVSVVGRGVGMWMSCGVYSALQSE
jgi:hypothetical protein